MQVNERERLDNASTQNFHSPTIVPQPKPQKPDEISFTLSFSFACSNSFKVLIGFVLLLLVAWNLYSRNNEPSNPEPSAPAPVTPANPATRN